VSYPGGWKAPRTVLTPDTSAPAPEQPGREACNDCGATGTAPVSFTFGRGMVDCKTCNGFGYTMNGKAPR